MWQKIRKGSRILAPRCAPWAVFSLGLSGCLGIPENASAVRDFDLERYLGTWYEIARLDHRFERGLSHVEAHYSLRDDGAVRVINKGYDSAAGKWETVEGRAYPIEAASIGRLKVSFFGPFFGAYNIIELDQNDYEYALVVGASTSYLWILARSSDLDGTILDRLVSKAAALGFRTDELIFPEHDSNTR